MHILLVDDDPEIRFLAGFVLEQAGHRVTAAETGARGIELGSEGGFDLVLLDYRLGDMNGDAVLGALRERHPGLPVAFLTGRDDDATVGRLKAMGAAAVITKPFDPEALAEQLVTALRGTAAPPGAE